MGEASGPLFSRHNHNHDPAIAKCQNGDLLASSIPVSGSLVENLRWPRVVCTTGLKSRTKPICFGMHLTVMTMLQRFGSTVKKPCITSMGFRPDRVTKEED